MRSHTLFGVSLCLAAMLAGEARAVVTYTDVSAAAGLGHTQGPPIEPGVTEEYFGIMGGAAAADYDGDGWTDLFFTRADDTDILYRNLGNGTFQDVTTAAFGPSPLNKQTNGAAWADIDNDGDLDLYVTVAGDTAHLLYTNQGNGTFVEEAALRGAQIGNGSATIYGTGVAFGDYDRDGYLDAFVTEWRPGTVTGPVNARLLKNRGAAQPGHFDDVTVAEGVSLEITAGPWTGQSFSFGPRFADLDGDLNPDLAITSDFGTSKLFWNEGPGPGPRFSDGTASSGAATGMNDMGSAIGDIDGDGLLDWFTTDIYFDGAGNTHPNGNRLFRNVGNRQFVDVTDTAGVRNGDWGWGASMLDYDNDGDLDITMTNGFIDGDQFVTDPMRLWENDGSGVFTEVGAQAGVDDTGQGRGLLTLDYDNDGDLDILAINNGQAPTLLRNDGGNANHYLRVVLEGTLSNTQGVGALITVVPDDSAPSEAMVRDVNTSSRFLGQSEIAAHFGLADHSGTIDEVRIRWPSGAEQVLRDVAADGLLEVVETPADFDLNGVTDHADLAIWESGFGSTSATIDQGDANGDGRVDLTDLLLWQRGMGVSATTSAITTVPEPASLFLLFALAGLAIANPRSGASRF